MKKIEMPDFHKLRLGVLGYGERSNIVRWFKENIEGKYLVDESELIEVEGRQFDNALVFGKGEHEIRNADKKAHLIKSSIRTIKQDSPEDVLRKITNLHDNIRDGNIDDIDAKKLITSLIEEAKIALESER